MDCFEPVGFCFQSFYIEILNTIIQKKDIKGLNEDKIKNKGYKIKEKL